MNAYFQLVLHLCTIAPGCVSGVRIRNPAGPVVLCEGNFGWSLVNAGFTRHRRFDGLDFYSLSDHVANYKGYTR
jgi:hypothetical protein